MPRRFVPDKLAAAIGRRVRQLRQEEGLSVQELAEESAVGSKGHVSSIEHGLVRPTSHTLKALADRLGVLPLDLLTFPWRSMRERVIDLTRRLSNLELTSLLKRLVARKDRSDSPAA